MSYTNSTTHYGFPLPLGTDLTVPMDYNQAFNDIDEHLFDAESNASTAATAAANAVETANDAAADVADLGTTVNEHSGRLTSLEQHDIVQDNKIDNLETSTGIKFDSVGIADAYINGLTYAVGDIVTYNGQRFKCITAVTAAEPFDADKWQGEDIQTVIDSELKITLIASSSSNATYASQLAELKSAFDALPLWKKLRAVLVSDVYIFSVTNTQGLFAFISANAKISISMSMLDNSRHLCTATSDGNTFTDGSSDVNSQSLKLYA